MAQRSFFRSAWDVLSKRSADNASLEAGRSVPPPLWAAVLVAKHIDAYAVPGPLPPQPSGGGGRLRVAWAKGEPPLRTAMAGVWREGELQPDVT